MQRSAEVFQQETCSPEVIVNNGVHFLLAIYGAPIKEVSLDNYRYLSFAKSTRFNKPVKLQSLPPTTGAARQHLFRVYYQVQTWLGNELNPEQWGWVMKDHVLEPVMTLLPPAPDELLHMIFCNCTKGCGTNCGCRKIGLPCSAVCGHCHGQSCLNAPPSDDSADTSEDINPQDFEYEGTNLFEEIDDGDTKANAEEESLLPVEEDEEEEC